MDSSATTLGQTSETGEEEHLAHVVPVWLLLMVWGALIVFTILTVSVANADLGKFNLWAAMIIAAIKATLVGLYFMHLRYEKPIIAIVFISTLIFLIIFIGFALMDSGAYGPELIPGYAPGITQ